MGKSSRGRAGEKADDEEFASSVGEENGAAPLIRNGSLVSNKLFVVESRISARAGPKMASHKRIEKEGGAERRYSCMQIIEQRAKDCCAAHSPTPKRVSFSPFSFHFLSTCCVRLPV